MPSLRTAVPLLALAALACNDTVEPVADAASGTDAQPPDGSAPELCGPDTTCPTAMPSIGAACEGSLSCPYTEAPMLSWSFECMSGSWDATNTECPHDGICTPPLGQSCSSPSTAPIAGATIELGPPAGAFRAFTAMETMPLVIGPQGGVMVQARLRLNAAAPPRCVELETALTVNGMAVSPISRPLTLHCGVSQPFFLILPVSCGEAAEHTVAIDATVTGAGSASAELRLTGGMGPCPRG
jgi:hypothetical protein